MKDITLATIAIPTVRLMTAGFPSEANSEAKKPLYEKLLKKTPEAIRSAMVLWFSPKLQGCTNENMAENPILKDLSGNGYDAMCYNFAWTEGSGIDADGNIFCDGVGNMIQTQNELTGLQNISVIWNDDSTSLAYAITDYGYTADGEIDWPVSKMILKYQAKIQDKCVVVTKYQPSNNNSYATTLTPYLHKAGIKVINGYTITLSNGISYAIRKYKAFDFARPFCLGGNRSQTPPSTGVYTLGVIKSLILFNRTLTEQEIEWVKTNLID